LDYVMPYERYETTRNSMLNLGLGMNGELFDLPAGTVRFAAGAEWREEKLDTRDDPDTAKLHNIVWSPGNDHGLHPDMYAKRQVSEVYGEVVVPVLANLPGVRRLDVE